MKDITNYEEYKTEISTGKSVIDFYAHWCPPCRKINPKFEDWEPDFEDFKFYKLNVDIPENKKICKENKISCMPTFIFFENGKVTKVVKGAKKDKVLEILNTL